MFIAQDKVNKKYFYIFIFSILLITLIAGIVFGIYWLVLRQGEPKIEEKNGLVEFKEREYRKEIIIDNLQNDESLNNFQISLNIDTLSLMREGKLSLDCGDIKFIDSDGKTEISYWMEGDCGEADTRYWLRIPEILSNTKKSIYVYYGNESGLSAGNFNDVFVKTNNLIGWYYLNNTALDFSSNKNDGELFGLDYIYPKEGDYVVFSNWQRSWEGRNTYFEVPAEGLNFDKSKGSIEMWLMPMKHLAELCYEECPKRYQRLVIDSNWQIELGIDPSGDLYFYPAQAPKNNYNMIHNPLKSDEWNHIIVTWNFETKEVIFYINGERKESDIENVPKYWKEIAQTGNWQFGGTSLEIESVYAGYIDGIRIYSKALSKEEVIKAYKYNARDLRYPTVSFGDEQLVSADNIVIDVLNLKDIEEISPTDKIKLNVNYYATPLDERYRWSGYYYAEKYVDPLTNKNLFLISKHSDDPIPLLGVPSHFFPYEGAPAEFKDSFLLSYVGLKINKPELIKDLKIEFKKIESYEYKTSKYLDKIVPTAYACGPFYSYRVVGDSELSFLKEEGGILWFGLKNPIFVNKETTRMQFHYKPNGNEGELSFEFADMVFIDKDKKYVRPIFSTDLQVNGYMYGERSPVDKYSAYFGSEEKGFILFKLNSDSQKLEMSLENRGRDPITIDSQSIWNIETQSAKYRIQDIRIQDLNRNVVYETSMDDIKNQIFGKEIGVGQTINLPFIGLKDLEKDKLYYIILGIGEKSEKGEIVNQKRIIRWIFGDDPYFYPRHRTAEDLYLYQFKVNQDNPIISDTIL